MKPVKPTTIVRRVLVSYGKNTERVFTNKYKNYRTVKAYAWSDLNLMTEVINEIRRQLEPYGIEPIFRLSSQRYLGRYCLPQSFIVQLPL